MIVVAQAERSPPYGPLGPFSLPDIAQFADVTSEWRNTKDPNLSDLRAALAGGVVDRFLAVLNDLEDFSRDSPALNDDEALAGQNWKNRLRMMFPKILKRRAWGVNDLLTRSGFVTTSIDIGRLVELTRPDLETLEATSPVRQNGLFDRSVDVGEDVVHEISLQFEASGLLEIVRDHARRAIKVDRAVLHLSMPDDRHWTQFLGDCPSTPPLTNLHFDPKEDVKAIVYLNKVGPGDGPFSVVEGSHAIQFDPLQDLLARSIATGNFCDTPAARRSLFRLPGFLRVTANFGRLLSPGTPLFGGIASRLRPITSDVGNCVVFQSGRLMHLGGIVREGRRVALQIIIR